MQVKRRAPFLAALAAACLILGAAGEASAFDVPPFKGNDTGGIIAWPYAQQIDARKLAAEHCAGYGKLVKRLATQAYYGGYISFACVWPRVVVVRRPARVVLHVRG